MGLWSGEEGLFIGQRVEASGTAAGRQHSVPAPAGGRRRQLGAGCYTHAGVGGCQTQQKQPVYGKTGLGHWQCLWIPGTQQAVSGNERAGLPPDAVSAVQGIIDDLQHRHTTITTPHGSTKSIPVNRGIIQGDCLSPLLFIIALEPLLRWLDMGERGYRLKSIKARFRPSPPHPGVRQRLCRRHHHHHRRRSLLAHPTR